MTEMFTKQLTDIITEYASGLSQSRYDDASDVFTFTQIRDLQTRCISGNCKSDWIKIRYTIAWS